MKWKNKSQTKRRHSPLLIGKHSDSEYSIDEETTQRKTGNIAWTDNKYIDDLNS